MFTTARCSSRTSFGRPATWLAWKLLAKRFTILSLVFFCCALTSSAVASAALDSAFYRCGFDGCASIATAGRFGQVRVAANHRYCYAGWQPVVGSARGWTICQRDRRRIIAGSSRVRAHSYIGQRDSAQPGTDGFDSVSGERRSADATQKHDVSMLNLERTLHDGVDLTRWLGQEDVAGVPVWRPGKRGFSILGGMDTIKHRGMIYFLNLRFTLDPDDSPPCATRYFKLGATQNWPARSQALKTGCPYMLEVKRLAEVPDVFEAEKALLASVPRHPSLDGGSEWRFLTKEQEQQVDRTMVDLAAGWQALCQSEPEIVPNSTVERFVAERQRNKASTSRQEAYLKWHMRAESSAITESDEVSPAFGTLPPAERSRTSSTAMGAVPQWCR